MNPAQQTPAPASLTTVILQQPIVRESGPIDAISLRRPKTGELRGLNLTDIMQSDVNAMMVLIPRIADPFLTAPELADMDPADFAELAGTVIGFFMNPAQKAMIAQLAGG